VRAYVCVRVCVCVCRSMNYSYGRVSVFIVRYRYLMLTYAVLPYQESWASRVNRYDTDGVFTCVLPMRFTVYDYLIIGDLFLDLLWVMAHYCFTLFCSYCLQCVDAVGWAAGKGIRPVKNMGRW